MKITEITRPPEMYNAKTLLKKAGYKELGGGSYGAAFARPDTPFILKLFTYEDYAYLQYLKLITTISNPHFPVVKGKPIKITNDYHAVRLERLTRLPKDQYMIAALCKKYIKQYQDLSELENAKWHDQQQSKTQTVDLRSNHIGDFSVSTNVTRGKLQQFEQTYPDLANALRLIVDHVINKVDARIDMHTGNFMMRGSILVITDPVAYANNQITDLPPSLKSPKQIEFPGMPKSPTKPTGDLEKDSHLPTIHSTKNLGSPLLHRKTAERQRASDEKLYQDLQDAGAAGF